MSRNNPHKSARSTGICALCGQHRPLCESHVVPEFLYKPLYNSKHQFFRLSTGERPERSFEQKGIRERLLCANCEGQFGECERYARGVLYGGEVIDIVTDHSRAFEARVDYTRFKLFELSLIWRAGVTSVPEFGDVVLGSHERCLRRMLREGDPGTTAEYGCNLIWPTRHRNIFDQLIMHLEKLELGGKTCHILVLGGMCWLFWLSKEAADTRQEAIFLQRTGELRIMRGDFGLGEYLANLAIDLYRNSSNLFPDSGQEE